MGKISLKKQILLALAVILFTIILSTNVWATSNGPISPLNVNGLDFANVTDNTTTLNNTTNNVTGVNALAPIVNNTVNNTTNNTAPAVSNYQNNTTLPQTGDASDYAVFALIGIAVVIAVFAFKKARDYNI